MRSRKITFDVDENNCFICTSHKPDGSGYFRIKNNGIVKMLHRIVYEECFDSIPEGLIIRHSCDNANCINPEHLSTGTDKDNARDRVERNRSARGSKHGRSKLLEQDVIEIKRQLAENQTVASLAREYSLDKKSLHDIKVGKNWKHIN